MFRLGIFSVFLFSSSALADFEPERFCFPKELPEDPYRCMAVLSDTGYSMACDGLHEQSEKTPSKSLQQIITAFYAALDYNNLTMPECAHAAAYVPRSGHLIERAYCPFVAQREKLLPICDSPTNSSQISQAHVLGLLSTLSAVIVGLNM